MNPLVALAATFLPDIIRVVAGDKAGTAVQSVVQAVEAVAGTADPVAAEQALKGSPSAASTLRTELAQIALDAYKARLAEEEAEKTLAANAAAKERADELAAYKASLADVSNARGMESALAVASKPTAWVAPGLSFIVTGGFFALVFGLVYGKDLGWSSSVQQIVNISVGALAAAFATVMNFWFGSSQSSRNKDAMVADLTTKSTAQTADVLRQATAVLTGNSGQAAGQAPAARAASGGQAAPASSTAAAKPAAPALPDNSGDFAGSLAFVLQAEGGYVDNPNDPGGPTNMGITLKTLEAWRGGTVTADDVRVLTRQEAGAIYKANYWDAMRCSSLPKGVDLMVFDCGVNAGPRRSILILQGAVGVPADGIMGPVTLAAAAAAAPRDLVAKLADARMQYYRGLPGWGTFGQGWTNRVAAVQKAALAMLG
jgi:hypothetical protein